MNWSISTATANSRARRAVLALVGVFALLVLFAPNATVFAAETAELPTVNDFRSARYDVLAKITVGDQSAPVYYGSGAVILPDRNTLTIDTPSSGRVSVIVIGTSVYVNEGNGWRQVDDSAPGQATNSQSTNQALANLQEIASSVVLIGAETVRGAPVNHYQVLVDGEQFADQFGANLPPEVQELLADSTLKYDMWIGTQDSYIHQINTSFNIPESEIEGQQIPAIESAVLLTYYDFNNPNIRIEAPI